MKALMKMESGNASPLQIVEVPEPVLTDPDSVKIRVAAAGICGTDLSIERGSHWCNAPVILGHEFSGTVVAAGSRVTGLKPGDRVVSETAQVICGHCRFCNTGNQLMCPERLSIGYGVNGAFTDYIVMRSAIVHKIPDSISFDEAAMCEPSAVAAHAVFDKVRLEAPDTVLITGPGTIGLLVAQMVLSTGAAVVMAGIDTDAERLAVARQLGVAHTVNSQQTDLRQTVLDLTDGLGCDYAFECSGTAPAIRGAMSSLRKKGTLVQVGLTQKNLEIEYSLLAASEISLIGSFGHNWNRWETVIAMMASGKLNVKPLITHSFGLADHEQAFQTARSRAGIKVMLHPAG